MNQLVSPTLIPAPLRALATDDPQLILRFAMDAYANGGAALATLVEIRGGAARALGSHVAVAADGRFCGYVSGGCVEAAVASEALLAMAEGRDRAVLFGDGSPFFDIVLPCGGGITVAIHLLRDVDVLQDTLDRLKQRQAAALRYTSDLQSLECVDPPRRSCRVGNDFITLYQPRTRVVVSGQTVEAEAVAAIAAASGYDVASRTLHGEGPEHQDTIDRYTAVILLHHDLAVEDKVLTAALRSPAFYIGALGSTRTHHRRVARLRQAGCSNEDIQRIKAPIGVFGPTRDSSSLALSILADVAAHRLMAYG